MQQATPLAPDFAGKYMAGDSFTITSPAVPGYTPQQTYVTMDSMPERDVEVTVVYTANAVPGPGPGPGPSPIPTVVPGIAPGPIAAAPGGAAIVSGPAGDGLTQLKDVKTAKRTEGASREVQHSSIPVHALDHDRSNCLQQGYEERSGGDIPAQRRTGIKKKVLIVGN